jgi:hypothetical protein
VKLLADENFDNRILRGVKRRKPDADIIRVQDTEMAGAKDPDLLAWAAANDRILLTHDIQTMNGHAYARVEAGLAMPGVVQVDRHRPHGQTIEDLLIFIEASHEGEWEGQVKHVPFR